MPLEQDLISITFDTEASGKSKEILLSQMKEVLELSTKINNTKINIGSNTTGLKDFIKLQGDAEKSTSAYNKTLITSAKVIQEQEKAQQQALKTSKLREQQSERNAKAEEKEAAARKKNADVPFTTNLNNDGTVNEPKQGVTSGNVLNDLDKAQIQSTNSATALGQAQSTVSNNLNVTKKSAEELRKEQELSHKIAVEDKLLASQRAAQLKNEVREQNAVKGSLEQRRAALIRLNSVYDNQSPQERASASGQRLLKITSGLTAQVKTLEADTGRAQRNVGNYGSALAGAGKAAFGFLRTAANIIPGLGISGIILLASDAISSLVQAALQGSDKLNRLAEVHKTYSNVLIEGNKSSAQEVVNLRVLEKAATDVSKPMSVRLAAVNKLQEQYPKYLANISDEAILHGDAAKQINLVADALYKKAFAEAASSKAAEFAGKQLELELKKNFLLNRQKVVTNELAQAENERQKALAKLNTQVEKNALVAFGVGKAQKELTQINNLLNQNSEAFKFNSDQITFYTDKAADNFGAVDSLEIDKKKGPLKTMTDAVIELRKELAKIQNNQDIGQITFSDADVERAKAYAKAFGQIFERGGNANTPIVLDLAAELKPIDVRILETSIKEATNKLSPDTKIELPVEIKPIDPKDEAAAYEKSIERRIRANDEAFAKEQTLQLEQFRSGLINKEDYESSLIDIAEKYSKQAIQIQIDELVAENEFAFNGVEQTQEVADKKAEIEKKIAQLRLQLLQGIQKAEDDDNKERLEKLENFIQKAQKVLSEASNLIGSVIDISVTKQKNALRDLEDERQKSYDREITNIQNLTLTEEEKQTKILSLEAKRQAQKDEFDRKNREADLKRAKFNKGATIAQIALETAAAVVHQLGSGDPFTAIPRAIAVGVLGAAKLAIAIATPLPKYATGLKNAGQDHIGMYGEAGSELVEMPGQDAFIAHKATIGFIPKGTSITPLGSNEINQMMHRIMMEQTAGKITKPDYDDRLERAFEKHSNRMIKAMGKRPAASNNRMEAKYQVDLLKTVYGRG